MTMLHSMMSLMLKMMMISYCLFDFHLRDRLEEQQQHVDDDDDEVEEEEDDYAENGSVMLVQMLSSQMNV